MKLIVHIGMGKTGTSSIQKALRQNEDKLAEQSTVYLGMWFTDIDPAFARQDGQRAFFAAEKAEMLEHAVAFSEALKSRCDATGATRFILSNEGFFGRVGKLAPFLAALSPDIEVSLIAYVRDPRSWLPSAYTQWGVRHKENKGPIQPFAERAATLVRQYRPLKTWREAFGDALDVRAYEKGLNVVQDFAVATDVELEVGAKRYLERAEPAEVLLRALFNDRFEAPTMPENFASAVLASGQPAPVSLTEMAERCFDQGALDDIIAENQEHFDYIRDEVGIDLMAGPAPTNRKPDPDVLSDRLLDYLTEITLGQAVRIHRLERDIKKLTESQSGD
ncbi:MAG: polysaccharide biosynthesis protein [Pikeienuella sp.]